jgi:hypothetical protein
VSWLRLDWNAIGEVESESADLVAVNVEIAGSSSLDSMDDLDVLNEVIKDEEDVEKKMEVDNVMDEHPSQVQEGGHPRCCDADIKVGWFYRHPSHPWLTLPSAGIFALSPEEDILFMSMSKRTTTTTPLMVRPLWRLVPCTRSCPTEMLSTGLSPTGWKMIWSKMLTGLNTDEGFSADVP